MGAPPPASAGSGDPRRPLTVGVSSLVRRLGTRKAVHRSVPFDDVAISSASVAPGEDVEVDLELESISNGLVATGELTVPWTGVCRRCLEPVRGEAVTEVREIFERHPVEGETYPFSGDVVDLGPMVRDLVLLALPLAPLCEQGCLGPDPDDYPATVEGDDDPSPVEGRDPRWAVLDQLRPAGGEDT
jgi:uncharacterized protein